MSEYLQENYYECEGIKPQVLIYHPTFSQHDWIRNLFAVTVGEKITHVLRN
jgi:hypothetical protein